MQTIEETQMISFENSKYVFDSILNDAILLIAVFHWQATIMGPVCKFYVFQSETISSGNS